MGLTMTGFMAEETSQDNAQGNKRYTDQEGRSGIAILQR